MLFYRCVAVYLRHFPLRHRLFTSRVILFKNRHKKFHIINCQLLKLVQCQYALQPAPTPPRSQSPPLLVMISQPPPGGHPLTYPLLVVKLPPSRQAVILHPCWRSNSPLSAQRSSSTPAGCQTHPSPPSSHPPSQLAANLTPPHPVSHLPPLQVATTRPEFEARAPAKDLRHSQIQVSILHLS